MMKKNYIILKNIFDIFVFVNSYLFTIYTYIYVGMYVYITSVNIYNVVMNKYNF